MIGDFLKKHVWADDPAAPASGASQQPAPQSTPQTSNFAAGQVSQSVPLVQTVNLAFVEALRKAIFSRQTALTTLLEAADKLNSIIPDAGTRYKAAWATSSQGRTVQQVAAAADIHVADIKGEVMKFENAVRQKLGSEVSTLESQATSLSSQLESSQRQVEEAMQRIAQLNENIQRLKQQQVEVTAQASAKRLEMENTTREFQVAAESVRAELEGIKSTVLSSIS